MSPIGASFFRSNVLIETFGFFQKKVESFHSKEILLVKKEFPSNYSWIRREPSAETHRSEQQKLSFSATFTISRSVRMTESFRYNDSIVEAAPDPSKGAWTDYPVDKAASFVLSFLFYCVSHEFYLTVFPRNPLSLTHSLTHSLSPSFQ